MKDFLSKRDSKIPAMGDSRRALVGDEIAEADGDQVLKGLESPKFLRILRSIG